MNPNSDLKNKKNNESVMAANAESSTIKASNAETSTVDAGYAESRIQSMLPVLPHTAMSV
ncbi:hypothetical protein DW830_10880 [Prevotella sp. AM34-19LB]|uniref:hypothetical protein n=1 Tax=Prevotella sp. AM34-19LB TaxID=2292364 RepID=UPI000E5C5E48|nr:hypothetical protein [Prevotella sp. AM34-19LB]RHC74744.1 hypothetical protein DW830_10880 [Prevotella sp. AM34-19LB]